MLKYEGRISSFCGGVETNVKCEGTPLTGKRLFRNELAQRYFDKLRNQLYLDDYGRLSEDKNTLVFFHIVCIFVITPSLHNEATLSKQRPSSFSLRIPRKATLPGRPNTTSLSSRMSARCADEGGQRGNRV